jgi:hypothetical protein
MVLCHRSTFPVAVGDLGAVSRCPIPFSAQIRDDDWQEDDYLLRQFSRHQLGIRTQC